MQTEAVTLLEKLISSTDIELFWCCSFSSTWKKTNQKKTPMSRGPCASRPQSDAPKLARLR